MLLLLLSAPLSRAADPAFAGAAVAGQAVLAPETRLAAELGGTFAGGNTRSYHLTASLDADHRWGRNKLTIDTGANLGRSVIDANGDGHLDDDEREACWAETARKAWLDLRQDRFFGSRDSLYLLAGGLLDPFSGYDDRVHAQAGYSRVLVATKTTRLVAEIGMDGAHEDLVAGVSPNTATILSVRGLGGVTHALSGTVTLAEKLEAFENVLTPADIRALNEVSLTTKTTNRFGFKLLHSVNFDHRPVDGFQRVDQTAVVTFIATIAPLKPATQPCPCAPLVPPPPME